MSLVLVRDGTVSLRPRGHDGVARAALAEADRVLVDEDDHVRVVGVGLDEVDDHWWVLLVQLVYFPDASFKGDGVDSPLRLPHPATQDGSDSPSTIVDAVLLVLNLTGFALLRCFGATVDDKRHPVKRFLESCARDLNHLRFGVSLHGDTRRGVQFRLQTVDLADEVLCDLRANVSL